jgi:TrmH family RNA methyltransferase
MARAEVITSAANPLLKDVRRALSRGGLTADGAAVAETFHLLEEALRSGRDVPVVLAAESMEAAVEKVVRRRNGLRVLVVADRIFNRLASTESSQGVIALVRPPAWTPEQLFAGCPLVVVLDGLQDPGNAGSIVRAAEAFGATGVLFVKGSVSPFNAKTLRASAGSLFRMPFATGPDPLGTRRLLDRHKVDTYATVPSAEWGGPPGPRPTPSSAVLELPTTRDRRVQGDPRGPGGPPHSADLTRPCALIIGNEARGVSEALRAGAAGLSIPTGPVESLNAAMACGILLYEAWRQRSAKA